MKFNNQFIQTTGTWKNKRVDWWLVLLGATFVIVTLVAPKGIGGLFDRFHRIGTPDRKGAQLGPDVGSLQEKEAQP